MSKEESQPNNQGNTKNLLESVFERIEKDQIAPTPRWQFLFHEYFIWGLWAATVLIGAVAVSVMTFVSVSARFAFYEATHESALEFFTDALPFVWALVFISMIGLAYFNIRHTKKGYRYPLWMLALSSLILSLLGGGLLHAAGMGHFIDTKISESMPMVRTWTGMEMEVWQAPENGRMVGVFTGFVGTTSTEALFTAVDGTKWTLDVSELMEKDLSLLTEGKKVRVVGMTATSSEGFFYGCGVIPWMLEKPMPVKELRGEREIFMERLEHHAERIEAQSEQFGVLEEESTEEGEVDAADGEEMHCPEMPLFKRVQVKMSL